MICCIFSGNMNLSLDISIYFRSVCDAVFVILHDAVLVILTAVLAIKSPFASAVFELFFLK